MESYRIEKTRNEYFDKKYRSFKLTRDIGPILFFPVNLIAVYAFKSNFSFKINLLIAIILSVGTAILTFLITKNRLLELKKVITIVRFTNESVEIVTLTGFERVIPVSEIKISKSEIYTNFEKGTKSSILVIKSGQEEFYFLKNSFEEEATDLIMQVTQLDGTMP